jgi:hypothetical protein
MAVIGILTCEILEFEFAHLLESDPDVARLTVLEDERSWRLIDKLRANGLQNRHQSLQLIPQVDAFIPDPSVKLEVLVRVMELALHDRKKILQEALVRAASEMGRHVEAIFLGYGLCGNALDRPEKLLAETGIPIFIPMDEDHPVDDCVGLLIGGRTCYYSEQCKTAGTFFMIPGWTSHWKRIFDKNFGKTSTDMARRLFAHYERSLLVTTPIMTEDEMHSNIKKFNDMFGLRTEKRAGTLQILKESWQAAKAHHIESDGT